MGRAASAEHLDCSKAGASAPASTDATAVPAARDEGRSCSASIARHAAVNAVRICITIPAAKNGVRIIILVVLNVKSFWLIVHASAAGHICRA
jgi:hypothetical protein